MKKVLGNGAPSRMRAIAIVAAIMGGLLVGVVGSAPPASATTGAYHHWSFDEPWGAFQDTGSGPHVAIGAGNGPQPAVAGASGLNGKAFVPSPAANGFDSPTFTGAIWFQSSPAVTSKQVILHQRWWGWAVWIAPDGSLEASVYVDNNNGSGPIDPIALHTDLNVRDGSWHHTAVSYDGTTAILYLDNAPVDTKAGNHPMFYGDDLFYIGSDEGVKDSFQGYLDEFSYFQSAVAPPFEDYANGMAAIPTGEKRGGGAAEVAYCMRGVGDPVEMSTGAFYESVTDLALGGRGPAPSFNRTYDSSASTVNSPYGLGWASTYTMAVVPNTVSAGGNGGYDVVEENGAMLGFAWDATKTNLVAPRRAYATLVDDHVNHRLTFQRRNATKFFFYDFDAQVAANLRGKLSAIQDLDLNTTFVGYDAQGLLGSVQDPSGRFVFMNWMGGSHIRSIADNVGRVVWFNYNGDLLSTVSDVQGRITTYGYDAGNRLESIVDARSNVVTFNHYDGQGRVDWQEDGNTYTPAHTGPHRTFAWLANSSWTTSAEGNLDAYWYAGGVCSYAVKGYNSPEAVTYTYTVDPVTFATTKIEVNPGSSGSPSRVMQMTAAYDAFGRVLWKTDAASNKTSYEYNAYNRVTKRTDPNLNVTNFTYDAAHPWRLQYSSAAINPTQGGPSTQALAYHYDEPTVNGIATNAAPGKGDLTSVADANHITNADSYPNESAPDKRWIYVYDAYGDVATTVDPTPQHNKSTVGYDAASRPVWSISPKGLVAGGTPDAFRSVSILDSLGATVVSLDANGAPHGDGFQRADSVSTLGSTDSGVAWEALGGSVWGPDTGRAKVVTAGTTPLVRLAANKGTAAGTVSFAAPVAQTGLGVAFHVQDASNFWSLRADTSNARWNLAKTVGGATTTVGNTGASSCCTATDRVAVSFTATGITVKINGQVKLTSPDTALATKTGVGLVATTTGVGRLDDFAVYSSGGGETDALYDASGNQVRMIDANGNVTTSVFSPANQRTLSTRADSSVVQAGFDRDGRMTVQADGNNKATSYGYDHLDRLTSMKDPLNRVTTFAYNATGTLKTKLDAFTPVRTTTYGYDTANRLKTVSYSDGVTPNVTNIAYDANGNRKSMSDGTGQSCYDYDSLGRLVAYKPGSGTPTCTSNPVQYVYDANSNVTLMAYGPGLNVVRGFDDISRMTLVKDWLGPNGNGNVTQFGYDANSNLTSEQNPNTTTATYTFDNADRATNILHKQGTTTLANYAYTRDPVGQLTKTVTTPTTSTATYGYNKLNQLTAATGGTSAYAYDAADNLKTFLNGSTMTYDVANEATTLKNAGGTAIACYTYDRNGERTSKIASPTNTAPCTGAAANTTTYAWDQAGRFKGVGGTSTSTHFYDGDGLRTKIDVGGIPITYVSDIGTGLPKTVSSTNTSTATVDYFVYGPDGRPFERIGVTSGQARATWLAHDQQGSTRLITAPTTGATWGTYDYDPYGQVTNHVDNTTNDPDIYNRNLGSTRLQYNGEWLEGDSGFLYLRARHLDPATGNFLSRDPANGLTRSAYGYVYGNPLNGSDPSGLCWGPDWACTALSTALNTVSGVNAVAIVFGEVTSRGNCGYHYGDIECYGAGTTNGRPWTFGNVVMNPSSTQELSDTVYRHEQEHSMQWAMSGWSFVPVWGLDRAVEGECNSFERGAGYHDGTYDVGPNPCFEPVPDRTCKTSEPSSGGSFNPTATIPPEAGGGGSGG